VREYLGFLAGVHRLARPKQAVEQAIATVGLQNEAGKKVHQLSKGYKQRVGLAAALLHDPEVLILDEPTSGLDPNQILEIREVIRRQGKQKTILFSSHILQEVEALCDRVIIINKGTIVADDMLSNMLKKAHGGFVTLVLKENINSEIFEEIENCSKFNSTTWNFKTDDPEQLKKRLLQIALQKNLNIISLTSEATNLEEVFKRLTS
jgi:ABC-2 type transport system ATP-binding protein